MTWTPEVTARCKALWWKMSSRRIAEIITDETGRPFTHNSIICKMNRERLSFRGVTPMKSRKRRPLRTDLSPAELESVRAVEREYSRRKRARARGQPLPPLPNRELLAGLPRPAAKPKQKPAVTPAPSALALAPPRSVPAAAPASADIPPSKGIPLTSVGMFQCKFIEGDPLDGPALCCGHPVAEGSSWCPGHRRLCTVPIRFTLRRAA
ncbi:GcrA family cell cycle regulator [Methylorubrum extorquens]|uniref:GcrA family cell cycle regulator n=1 Tax=Methylorubrum extorquens TaxID=408 RepID=UPI00209DE85E|nr:GcrA family cell cycle regulator [Methylorubrum extorquens]MCP1539781.1 hypothetical protein [Methylorubrum extorquens]